MNFRRKYILITGSHRSGTTWCGHILNISDEIYKIHEPFNISVRPNSPFKFWFQFLENKSNNESEIKFYLKSLNWNYRNGLNEKTGKNFGKLFYLIKSFFTKKNLYKDPIALASAEWLFKTFNSRNIIMIRHPAAFIASIKQKGWNFDFNNFSDQPELINKHLKKYKKEIFAFSENKNSSIIEEGILLWNCLYTIVSNYQKEYSKEWLFIKHEDLSRDPINNFKKIFDFVDVDLTDKIINEIELTTQSNKNTDLYRNSEENLKKWKSLLTEEEIELIKIKTKNVWSNFYTHSDW